MQWSSKASVRRYLSLDPKHKKFWEQGRSWHASRTLCAWRACFPGGSDGKESAWNVGDPGLIPGLGRFPWRRKQLSAPGFLPGESHGQRSLEGSAWREEREVWSQAGISSCETCGPGRSLDSILTPKGHHWRI